MGEVQSVNLCPATTQMGNDPWGEVVRCGKQPHSPGTSHWGKDTSDKDVVWADYTIKAEPISPAKRWLNKADRALVAFIKRHTLHAKVRWDAPDYVTEDEFGEGGDGRVKVTELEDAEAMSSALSKDGWIDWPEGKPREHGLMLDIDVPAWLIPSSTAGHSHLLVDLRVSDEKLWSFLDACVEIGLVEPGYVSACKSRGMTSLRLPWIVKGEEPSTLERQAQAAALQEGAAIDALIKPPATEAF